MLNTYDGYFSSAGINCTVPANAARFDQLLVFTESLNFNRLEPNGFNVPDGLDDFQEFYAWLPGNLFIGPTSRSDDPGSNIETGAQYILGATRYGTYQSANAAMLAYIASGRGGDLITAEELLAEIAAMPSVYPLSASNWIQNPDGTYKINTAGPRSLALTTPQATKPSCKNLKSKVAGRFEVIFETFPN